MTASSSALSAGAKKSNVLESEVNSPPSSLLIRIVRVLLGVVRAVCAVRLAAGGAHAVAIVTDPVEAPQADLRARKHMQHLRKCKAKNGRVAGSV